MFQDLEGGLQEREETQEPLLNGIELVPLESPILRDGSRPAIPRQSASLSPRPSLVVEEIIVPSVSSNSLNRTNPQQMKNTELLNAIGNDEEVASILRTGANPNASCAHCLVSACHVAALKGGKSLKLLLDAGAEADRVDKYGRNPIHFAAYAGNDNEMATLLKSFRDMENNLINGRYCLGGLMTDIPPAWKDNNSHYCKNTEISESKAILTLPRMMQRSAWMRVLPLLMALFQPGWTPLHVASARAHVGCTELLLESGANILAEDDQGRTALDVVGYAFYYNHDIIENDFINVIKIMVERGGKFNKKRNEDYLENMATPLHTAVEIASLEAIKLVLAQGVSASCLNQDGLTPLHVCVKKKLENHLSFLCSTSVYADVKNGKGATSLQAAIDDHWVPGINIILKAGAAVSCQDNDGNTSIHSAARLGDVTILKQVLKFVRRKDAIDYQNKDGYTALLKATFHGHTNCVKELIEAGANLRLMRPGKISVLHIAARHGHREILEILLDKEEVKDLINATTAREKAGRTPLHDAILNKHFECIKMLLKEGADLSKRSDTEKKEAITAAQLIFNKLPEPTKFMEDVFDSYVSIDGSRLKSGNDIIKVDYKVLIPRGRDMEQMGVLEALINTGNRYDQQRLLVHPLVQSFIYRKWQALSTFFYIAISFHILNLLSFTAFIMSMYFFEIPNDGTKYWEITAKVCLLFKLLQETFLNTLNLLYTFEEIVKVSSVIFSIIVLYCLDFFGSEWRHVFATVALFLSWIDILYLFSRVPCLGKYVLMFEKITFNVVKTLSMFTCLIIGFALSFVIQFRQQAPFETPWAAFTKTMVMMTSEFDYKDMFYKDNSSESSTSLVVTRIFFLIFLVVAAIVLMNLLVAIAVNDINDLKTTGTIKKFTRQVGFITEFDSQLYSKLLNFLRLKDINLKLKRLRVIDKYLNMPGNMLPRKVVHSLVDLAKKNQNKSSEENFLSELNILNARIDDIIKELNVMKCSICKVELSANQGSAIRNSY